MAGTAGGFGGTLTALENLVHPDDRERTIGLTRVAAARVLSYRCDFQLRSCNACCTPLPILPVDRASLI